MIGYWIAGILLFIVLSFFYFSFKNSIINKRRNILSNRNSLVFLIKNKEWMTEGIIRECFSWLHATPSEVIAIDTGSVDETYKILQKLARKYPNLTLIRNERNSDESEKNDVYDNYLSVDMLSQIKGKVLFIIDLTSAVEYRKIIKCLNSIFSGNLNELYQTKIVVNNKSEFADFTK